MQDISGTALLYSGGLLDDIHAKTAHGLLRYSDRFQILGLIDPKFHGSMSEDFVRHCKENLENTQRSIFCTRRITRKTEISCNGSCVWRRHASQRTQINCQRFTQPRNGCRLRSASTPIRGSEFIEIAQKNGAKIHDIRKPKKAEQLRFWNGDIKK